MGDTAPRDRLTQFCLRGLGKMYLPQEPGFSASFHMDTQQNIRGGADEYRYTLNALLGLNRVLKQGVALPWNLEKIYARYVRDIAQPYVNPANAGMALWVAAELGIEVPTSVDDRIGRYLNDQAAWPTWDAQDFGWLILSLTAASSPRDMERAAKLVRFVLERLLEEKTGLFRFCPEGFRRSQASFGGLTYMTFAMLRYGRAAADKTAAAAGLAACRTLIELQGPQGQWPWMINVRTGTVSDWYQVYSVHQDSMAALFLTEALALGCEPARQAIVRGFDWVFGANEMGRSMIARRHSMIYRSVLRRGRLERANRLMRMLRSEYIGARDRILPADLLRVNPECRSYHLGWMLYVFSGRSDFDGIINHGDFAAEGKEPHPQ